MKKELEDETTDGRARLSVGGDALEERLFGRQSLADGLVVQDVLLWKIRKKITREEGRGRRKAQSLADGLVVQDVLPWKEKRNISGRVKGGGVRRVTEKTSNGRRKQKGKSEEKTSNGRKR